MATHTMIAHSSSSALAASSPLKETLPLFTTRSLTFPRKSSFSRLRLRFFAEKLSQLDSSNGCASLQDCKKFLPSSSFLEPLCVWTVWFISLSFGGSFFPFSFFAAGEHLTEEHDTKEESSTLSITVVGASGDLAKKKIFPALFALFYEGCLPQDFSVFGYARTKLTHEELRVMISRTLTCRIDQRCYGIFKLIKYNIYACFFSYLKRRGWISNRESCVDKMDQFLKRCFYHSGQYNSEDDFAELNTKLKEKEVYVRDITFFYNFILVFWFHIFFLYIYIYIGRKAIKQAVLFVNSTKHIRGCGKVCKP